MIFNTSNLEVSVFSPSEEVLHQLRFGLLWRLGGLYRESQIKPSKDGKRSEKGRKRTE